MVPFDDEPLMIDQHLVGLASCQNNIFLVFYAVYLLVVYDDEILIGNQSAAC